MDKSDLLQRQLDTALALVDEYRQTLAMEPLDSIQWKRQFTNNTDKLTPPSSGAVSFPTPSSAQQPPLRLLQTLPPEILCRIALFAGAESLIPLSQSMRFYRLHFAAETSTIFNVAQAFHMPISSQQQYHHDPTSNVHMDIPLSQLHNIHLLCKHISKQSGGAAASIKLSSLKWLSSISHLLPTTLDVKIIVSSCDALDLYDSDDSGKLVAALPGLQWVQGGGETQQTRRRRRKFRTLTFCCYDTPYSAMIAVLPQLWIDTLVLPGFISDELVPAISKIQELRCIQLTNAVEFREESVIGCGMWLTHLSFSDPRVEFGESLGEVLAWLSSRDEMLGGWRDENGVEGVLPQQVSFMGKLQKGLVGALVDWEEELEFAGWEVSVFEEDCVVWRRRCCR
ncbi:hypothetical protein BDR26DRAFT_876720 [Obelidium mucronatum]|nr:hypothetical protein BDR26DRAFT_876720 [Obelidium mucronatum]